MLWTWRVPRPIGALDEIATASSSRGLAAIEDDPEDTGPAGAPADDASSTLEQESEPEELASPPTKKQTGFCTKGQTTWKSKKDLPRKSPSKCTFPRAV